MSETKKRWSAEDDDYLDNQWGQKSVKSIAKYLERTEDAIVVRAVRRKLGAFLESGDYVTLNSLLDAINIKNKQYIYKSWICDKSFPAKNKKVRNNSFKVVKISDFWKWAETNREKIDFSKIEPNILGIEPEWVKFARKSDALSNNCRSQKHWTTAEDNLLKDLLATFHYNTSEISERLCRSELAIQRRIITLGLKLRPIPSDKTNPWSDKEIQELFDMIDNKYSYNYIKQKITNHTLKAIRAFIYRYYGTENLDSVREMRRLSIT